MRHAAFIAYTAACTIAAAVWCRVVWPIDKQARQVAEKSRAPSRVVRAAEECLAASPAVLNAWYVMPSAFHGGGWYWRDTPYLSEVVAGDCERPDAWLRKLAAREGWTLRDGEAA